MAKWIPKEDMMVGAQYECEGRNLGIGTWNGEAFEYQCTKFGITFQDTEDHWDNGAPFGTCKPIRRIVEAVQTK